MAIKALLAICVSACFCSAQGTRADYDRALKLRETFQNLSTDIADPGSWIADSTHFVYRKSLSGGRQQFLLVDATTALKQPAFDHARLADSLSKASGVAYTPEKLPFTSVKFIDGGKAMEYAAGEFQWKTDLSGYATQKLGPAPRLNNAVGRPPHPPVSESFNKPVASPDGKWEALILNYNLFLRAKGAKDSNALSFDGSEGNYYEFRSIVWSPDSRKIAVFRVKPGQRRTITLEDSAPADQVQPKYITIEYAKPGDTVDIEQPVLFTVADRKEHSIDNSLFSNPFALTRPVCGKTAGDSLSNTISAGINCTALSK